MKRITLSALFIITVAVAFSQTADEVLNRFMEASGGREKLSNINTLHYNQLIKLKSPMGDIDIPLEFFREKNKFFRMQASLQLGPQSLEMFTILTDTSGYIMLPANPITGAEGGLQKLEAKDVESQAYQLDAAGLFSPLVNYASKGHKVEMMKEENVNGEDSYKLKVTLKNSQELVYFISKSSNLVLRVEAQGAMAASMSGLGSMMGGMTGGQGVENMKVSTDYTNYKDVDGIKFPTKVMIRSQMGDTESELKNIEINKPIEAKWYKPA